VRTIKPFWWQKIALKNYYLWVAVGITLKGVVFPAWLLCAITVNVVDAVVNAWEHVHNETTSHWRRKHFEAVKRKFGVM